jgi:hypothetical protein
LSQTSTKPASPGTRKGMAVFPWRDVRSGRPSHPRVQTREMCTTTAKQREYAARDLLPVRLSDDTVSLEQPSFANRYFQDTLHPLRCFHSGYADPPVYAATQSWLRNTVDAAGGLQVAEYQPWACRTPSPAEWHALTTRRVSCVPFLPLPARPFLRLGTRRESSICAPPPVAPYVLLSFRASAFGQEAKAYVCVHEA